MYTYQDLLNVGTDEKKRMEFIQDAIHEHKNSDAYNEALTAQAYDKKRNVTIIKYQKLLYTIAGVAVPDNYSANYKLCSNFFNRFVVQQSQYLLGNGVSLTKQADKDKLGKDFDVRLQELGRKALVDAVAFGFWNYDHLEAFRLTEFKPFWDEETGALCAGIRFWQIDKIKPMRATLYEMDGYTEYIWREGKGEIYRPKRSYVLSVLEAPAGDSEIIDGYNYPSLPIVPLWANPARQSELVGIQEQIDCYDLIKSGFANDLDDASQIYWTIQNAGGMDDVDLAQFIQHMKTVKAAVVEEDGATAESHTLDVPYASREALLERLRNDLYEDYMALDVQRIAGGAVTATQIKAAYEPLNNKADMYEYCVHDFLDRLFHVVGIDSEASFTRSVLVNAQENIEIILQAAQYLPSAYVTQKILETLGDGDKTEEILRNMQDEEFRSMTDETGSGAEDDGQETGGIGGEA